MEIRSIEYFLILKKYEHMAVAADFLNISQPALSKSIRALEEELGVKLFDRVGRRIKLNQNGENFARYAEQSLQLLQMGTLTTKSRRYEVNGSISIDCYAYAPMILPCVDAYSELNPNTTFTVTQWQSSQQHGEGEMPDFLLRSAMDDAGSIKKDHYWVPRELFSENYLLIASPEYDQVDWEKYEETLDFSLLQNGNFIIMMQDDVFFNDFTFELCRRAGFAPKIYCKTDDFVVKVKLVERKKGIVLIPESCLDDAKKLYPELKVYPCPPDRGTRHVFLFHPKEAMMTEAAKDFYEFAIDYYGHKDEEM